MRYHHNEEINERIGRLIDNFREGEILPFTSDRPSRMTIAEIVEEVRLFYGERAACSVTISVH
jgi:hypothetical protein